ncbi:hypothetical protein DQG13_19810 [Paenibacillus sp. YN15]|nr:hypothetical protein DQG13_19810 [Paenibacillus sp. YN15]
MSDRLDTFARFDEDIPEPVAVDTCAWCREAIYVGDEVWRVDDSGSLVHSDTCANAFARERVYDICGVVQADGTVE